jgi:predicted enzyme related to lactoylglutathione lyase
MLIAHAYIEVADLERGIAFYCGGLGLSLKRRLGAGWVELEGANLPLFLLGNRAPIADLGGKRVRRSFARHWTPVHLDFVVPDLDAAVARLVGLGAALDRPVQNCDYGRMANLADPFGNGIDLIEFSGAGYDGISR